MVYFPQRAWSETGGTRLKNRAHAH